MLYEEEMMWDAMKGVHFKRTAEALRESLKEVFSLDGALTEALNTITVTAHAEAGTLWFYDKYGDGRVRPRIVYGGADIGHFSLAPGEGIAGKVAAGGDAIIVYDCQSDPRWAGKVDSKTGFQTKTMICVPLQGDKECIGSIQLINKTDGILFDKRDLWFCEELAASAARTIERSPYFDEFKKNRAR